MIIDEDWTFVTGNSRDFRGRRRDGGLFSKEMIHAGLVCLNAGASGTFSLNIQRELLEVALDEFKRGGDLLNQVLELTMTHDGDIEVLRYDLP